MNPPANVRSPIAILTVVLVIAWTVLSALAWLSYRSYRETRPHDERTLRIEQLRGTIIHIDEVLTMSARMAASTGDLQWEARYRRFERRLDASIREAIALAPGPHGDEGVAETDAANVKLVRMEGVAFDLVRQGRAEEARAVLFSDEYESQKRIYAEGMSRFSAGLSNSILRNMKEEERFSRLEAGAVFLLMPLLTLGWIAVFRAVRNWKATLGKYAEELVKANESLDRKVAERTQTLQREISEREQAEAALRESHQRLQETLDELKTTQRQVIQHERLRALGEMASGVGHDLNNSLSPVLGYSEILLENPRLPGNTREFLKWIRNGARDAAAVVARLREFYRPPSPGESRRPVELAGLLDEVAQLTRFKWREEAQREGRRIELEVRSEDASWAPGNAAEIREVLTNLVFNAVDAMPSGGCIVLRSRNESGKAVVEVIDTGVGMSAGVRAKCIEPFFTTKDHEGTGLGLSVCHGIVQRHGGRIEIDSLPGQGTTVRVFLPSAKDGPLLEKPMAEVHLSACRVLYIDDDPRTRSVVGDMLESLGQEVDLAEGGVRGLELLETNEYDLVITDLGMPDMDGSVVTAKIKATQPDLPVAMLTGWASPAMRQTPRSVEAPDHVLSKPPSLAQLRELLQQVPPRME